MRYRSEVARWSRSVAQSRSLLHSADGKGLLPLIPARLADAVIGLAVAVLGVGSALGARAAFTMSRSAVLATLLNLITAMLVLAIIVALLGVVNTLALSVVERTRDLGLLRAIGMRRGQLAQMVAAESIIIAVIGAVLGSALGLALGAALAEAFTRSQQATVSIPVAQIAAYVVATALAGVLAAIAPARRAARLNVLEAIAAE
jgi:putative ABC transport system permease protein